MRIKLLISTYLIWIFPLLVLAQVNADFTASDTQGCGSLQVAFEDQSTSTAGAIVEWNWDLAGVASNNQDPGRIFGTPGEYTICLTATDSEGNSDTECKTNFVQVFELPQPSFVASDQIGCTPFQVSFTNTSTSVDGTIVEYIWGVGGTTGVVIDNGSMPVITTSYDFEDEYTVSLTVFDDNGCVNSVTEPNFITTYDPPQINISISDTFNCAPPFVVTPINNDPDPSLQYTWDFGNGLPPVVNAEPSGSVYTQNGIYTITVIAQNPETSCSDTLILEDIINVGAAVSFEPGVTEICEGESVSFSNTSLGGVSNLQWNFGDGGQASGNNPTHVFNTPGCFSVTLTGTIDGCTDTYTHPVCIQVNPNPTASMIIDQDQACVVPHVVNFTGFSNNAVEYAWDFGDGNDSDQQNPSHTYTAFGTYTVTLEVTDANGCTQTTTDQVQVIETEASMTIDVIADCTPLEFTISDNSTTVTPIVSWFWSLDTTMSDPNSPLFTSTDPSPFFSVVDTGWYDITLTVTNSLGCTSTITNTNAVGVGILPVPNFEAVPLIACVDEPVTFTDLSSEYTDAWFWDFGEGGTSVEQDPTYAYTMPGSFEVVLTAAHNGCDTFLAIPNYITIQDPLAEFTITRDCNNPYEIAFTDVSTGADSIIWDFGLGNGSVNDTSTLLNPVVLYPDTGCYETTLIAYNFSTGCIDTSRQNICISDPEAEFELSPLVGCVPLQVSVTNESNFDIAWQWTAPGGVVSIDNAQEPIITYNTPGIYSDVQLIVTDVNGCRDTLVSNAVILVDGVDAVAMAEPAGGCDPLLVDFSNNSTSFDSPLDTYEWQVNDLDSNYTFSGDQLSYQFDSIGSYPVVLVATNELGCVGTDTIIIDVSRPVVDFVMDSVSCPQDTIFFENLSMGDSLQYLWTFGDGDSSTVEQPFHIYTGTGNFIVCLEATDLAGCTESECQIIEISVPTAGFSIDSVFADCPPLIATFTNESVNALYYEWSFGDSSGVSVIEDPAHVYTVPGVYGVQLVASINEFCSDTVFVDSLITLEGPRGDFFFDLDTACVGTTINFYGEAEFPYTFIWDFGDGVLDTTQNVVADTIVYSYNEPGVYIPKLILVDINDCPRVLQSIDTIRIEDLSIDFAAFDTTLCEGASQTTFVNLSTSTVLIEDQQWFFENGSPPTSTEFEPVVNFPNVGNFDVGLMVDNGFCRDTLFKDDYIGAGPAPEADFTASGTQGCTPYGIQFLDQSSVISGNIENYYWNFGGIGIVNEQNPFYTYTTGGTFEVQLVVETEFRCTDTATVEVTVSEPANPFLSVSKKEICIGDVIPISVEFQGDTSGVEYFWLDSPTLSCTECLEPIASPLVTTDYFFVTNTAANCLDTTVLTVNVSVNAIPEITLTADTTICYGDVLDILCTSDGLADTYEWDTGSDSLSCYDCNNPIASPLISTSYSLTVTNSFGCDVVDSVFVGVVDQRQDIFTDDRTICEGDSVLLEVDIDGIPTWLNNIGLSCEDCNDPLAGPSETQVYPFQIITTDFGCLLEDTIIVNVYPLDGIDAGEDDRMCFGEIYNFSATAELAGNLLWTPGASLSIDTIPNPVATPPETTTYYLTLEEDLCVLQDSVTLEVQYDTEVDGINYVICEGDTVALQPIGEADTWDWTPEESLDNSMEEVPLAFPVENTIYTLTASLSTCIEDTAQFSVIVNQGPELAVPLSYNKYPGVDVQMNVEVVGGNGAYTFQWQGFDGLSCYSCPDPIVTNDTSGFYTVFVTDELNGCTTEQQVFINKLRTCDPDLLYVPNIFTPNGDGYNEEIKVFTGTIPEIESFRIFNRWGATVFETNNIDMGWDGFYKGQRMPAGVYVYVIEATCPIDGSPLLKQGEFTMMH